MDASVNRIKSSADERAVLIGIRLKDRRDDDIDDSLQELKLLVKTAGANIINSIVINRDKIDPAHIIGKGYIEKLKETVIKDKIALIVFDMNNMKPAQVRNLEDELKCRVVGRTEIILDIFSKRARSTEACIQVELAQLRYLLPRLKGLGGVLSRTGGGIGTKGPGEKMLETDKRHILKRISILDNKLKNIAMHRKVIRKSRHGLFGAVVGYTNTGKSTLLNYLARDDLFVENRLFATLDAYTRSVYLNPGKKVLLTDTVGFIRNLPANLIESFKSTLEEIQNAHFLIHVVDINFSDIEKKIKTVNDELGELNCHDKRTIIFFNKSDAVRKKELIDKISNLYPGAIIGSAKNGDGIDLLKTQICNIYDEIIP